MTFQTRYSGELQSPTDIRVRYGGELRNAASVHVRDGNGQLQEEWPADSWTDPDNRGHDKDWHNLATDVPDNAWDIYANQKPEGDEWFNRWTTVDASEYDNESGDLAQLVKNAAQSGEIVDLGSGTYEWTSKLETTSGWDVMGMVGDGATIKYRGADSNLDYLMFGTLGKAVFKGITFDISENDPATDLDTDVGILYGVAYDNFWAEDVSVVGQRHRSQNVTDSTSPDEGNFAKIGGRFTWRVDIANQNSVGINHRVELPDGELDTKSNHIENPDQQGDYSIPFSTDPQHEGTLVYKDCYVNKGIDNGFYVSRSNTVGEVILWNCHAKDCGSGNMRISENDTVVGGLVEIHDTVQDWPGAALVAGRGSNINVIGLAIEATYYASDAIQIRTEADGITFDRVTLDTDYVQRPIRLSSASTPNVQITADDCYWVDRHTGTEYERFLVDDADVTFGDDFNFAAPNNDNAHIQITAGSTITYGGLTYGEGGYTPGEMGINGDAEPIPSFHFDYSVLE